MELLTNNGVTTLGSSLSNVATTLTVSDASAFPGAGNFTVRIENEILKVTGVSGTTFTVTRGEEGTTPAAHGNGTSLNFSLTAASIKRFMGEFSMSGNGTDRPSPTENGRSYIHTDQPLIARVVNGAWKTWFGGYGPFTPVLSSAFPTWVSQSTYGYVVDATDSFVFGDTGGQSGDNARMRLASISGDASLQAAYLTFRNPQADNVQAGIVLRESSTGKHIRFVWQNTNSAINTFAVYRYTNDTSFDTALLSETTVTWNADIKFLKVVHTASGTLLTVYGSADYINWKSMYSVSYSSFFTPNQMGFCILSFSTPTGIDCYMNILAADFTP